MSDPKVVYLFKDKTSIPDLIKWALPLIQAQDSPEVKAGHKASQARAKARRAQKERSKLKTSFKIIS